MTDPIVDVAVAFATTLMQNPVTASLITGAVRTVTGFIQSRLLGGKSFDKKVFGATMTKYLVAVNALSVFVPPQYASVIALVVDIGTSTANKLKNGTK